MMNKKVLFIGILFAITLSLLLLFSMNQELFLLINTPHSPTADWIALTLSQFGHGMIIVLILLLLVPFLKEISIRAFIAIILAGTLSYILKELLAVPRPVEILGPDIHILGPTLTWGSVPSGHAAGVFALVFSFKQHLSKKWFAVLFLLATSVGISRIYMGAHFPFDVAIGAMIGWMAARISNLPLNRLFNIYNIRHVQLERLYLAAAFGIGIWTAWFNPMLLYIPSLLRPLGTAGSILAIVFLVRSYRKSKKEI